MKLGTCHLWGQDLAAFRAEVRLAATLGYDLITIGDTPAGWHDVYVSLAIAAIDAPHATLAPLVTSPFIRHPLAAANALSSLYDWSNGRVAMGLSTGGSNVMAIGRGPASQKEIRAEVAALKALFAGEGTSLNEASIKPLRFARSIPIYYSAFGPKALALAGEQADGVILFFSDKALDKLEQQIGAVRSAARAANRDPECVDIWAVSFASVRQTRAQAIDDLKAFIAVNAVTLRTPAAMAKVPQRWRGAMQEMLSRYDFTEHVVVGGHNVSIMEELGLTEFLADFDTTAGSVEEVAETLRRIEAMGVSTFIVPLAGHADPAAALQGLKAARDAM